jgi:predicted site-specific integrase-resolvase
MRMTNYSSSQAAVRLGIPYPTLVHYIRVGKIPKPKSFTSGGTTVHVWSEEDIERVRKLLPKIANGRKTRYKKQSGKKK